MVGLLETGPATTQEPIEMVTREAGHLFNRSLDCGGSKFEVSEPLSGPKILMEIFKIFVNESGCMVAAEAGSAKRKQLHRAPTSERSSH